MGLGIGVGIGAMLWRYREDQLYTLVLDENAILLSPLPEAYQACTLTATFEPRVCFDQFASQRPHVLSQRRKTS